jgi:hypothetical protein
VLTSHSVIKLSSTAVCQKLWNDENLKSAFIKMFIVIALLSVQMSESFVFAQMPCSDEMAAVMDLGSHDMQSAHDMMKHSQSDDMNDCCQQDCCCPMAMFHIGLLSSQAHSSPDGVSLSIQSLNPNLNQIFLGGLQRPPKHSLI